MDKYYGKELIIDLSGCDVAKFTRKSIREYCQNICDIIEIEKDKLTWSENSSSAVQFIKTSNITINTVASEKTAYINVFSCKEFNGVVVMSYTRSWFRGTVEQTQVITRI